MSVQEQTVATSAEPKLVRTVSRWQIVALAVNDVVGSGVYLLPAAAAALLGEFSVLAVVLAGAAVALLVLCFAEASSYFDEPGGGYLYTREAFGRLIGFEVGWMTWLARVASVASLTAGFALATTFFWPAADAGWPRAIVITVPIVLFTWVNVRGVRPGVSVSVAFAVAKTLPLILFVLVGLVMVDWSRLTPTQSVEPGILGEAALLLLFAYAGFENVPAAAGEYRNPKRDVPFALVAMISLVTLLYLLVQVVALGTLPLPALVDSESPLADSATLFLGASAGTLMAAAAMVSIVGNAGNTILIGPRYLFALAIDGYGPRAMASVHPQYRTPAVAIITQSVLALGLALSGTFVGLAMLSIVARLSTYVGTAAAIPRLRRLYGDRPEAIRLPGGLLIPLAAIALCVVFLASATTANLLAGLAALAVGLVIYYFRRMS